jgi:hypothetical protein
LYFEALDRSEDGGTSSSPLPEKAFQCTGPGENGTLKWKKADLKVSLPFMLLLEAPQRPRSVREVRRIQHLNTGMVLAVERCDGSRAASFLRIVWRVEPQTQMIELHRRSRWVCCRIIVEYLWCRGGTRSNNEGLDVEALSEILLPDAIV